MRSVRVLAVGALMVAGLVGCRNRVAEERDLLWQQNREQQATMARRNAELEAQREAQRRAAAAAAVPLPVPPVTAPAPQPPAPPVSVEAPEPTDLGGDVGVESDPSAGTVTLNLS